MTQYYNTPHFFGPRLKKPPIYSINADVVLGVLGNGCKGLGICRIIPKCTNDQSLCRTVSANIIRKADSIIYLRFDFSGLCETCQSRYFGASQFVMEEDFKLPSFIVNSLRLKANIIPSGNYFWKDGKKGGVCFNLINI